MSNLSWAPSLILAIGILLVSFGVIAFIADQIAKAKQFKRQSRRQRNFEIMQDLKDLNS